MNLSGTYDSDNIFAKILRGEMPCVKIYEDEDVLSFMDMFPQSRGHTLVIPKQASRNLLDADADVLATLIRHTQTIARAVAAGLKPDGLILTQFNGTAAGQTVFHLHFHIIPRYADMNMGRHSSGRMADMSDLKDLAEHIKEHL
ncbi:MAG: HIT family protein [Hyphomonadaceae bacterium]|nr:HIT family protein [Hyphomonadaceae bacterium]MBC6412384.1 HIT family protein [Hyphomonadaceae bacterium]